MSATSGPDIVSDGLVFYYDTGNSIDSYLGEPTTNVIADPEPLSGWTVSNYLTSTATITYSSDNGIPHMELSNVNVDGSYPRISMASLTSTITDGFSISFEAKSNIPDIQLYFALYSQGSTKITRTATLSTEWQRFEFENETTGFTLDDGYLRVASTTSGAVYYIRRIQVEQKSHATPFVNGTRSTTGALLDISGQGVQINLANVSFDSNAQMTFDGTDDRVDVGLYHLSGSSHTEEVVLYRGSTGTAHGILSDLQYGFYGLYVDSDNKVKYRQMQANPGQTPQYPSVTIASSTSLGIGYYHIAGTFSNTDGFKLYVNGELEVSNSTILPFNLTGGRGINHIGVYKTSDASTYTNPFNGRIELVKAYNKALTASEVQQNYDSLKTRFGLI